MFKIDRNNLQYAMLGVNIAVGMFLFSYIGYWIDKRQNTQIWILMGILLGLCYGAYEIWKAIQQINRPPK